MTLLHIHSHHPLSCKEGIIYSQAIQYNMIISEDHIPQEQLNNLTRNPNRHHIQNQIFSPLLLASRTWENHLKTPSMRTGRHTITNDAKLSTIWPSKPLSAYTNSSSIYNHLVHFAQTYGSSQHNS